MSRSGQVQHFTHIHPLTKVEGYGEFMCGGCKTYGFGSTYRCTLCDYNLHDQCATCPPTLHSFMHPHHELRLVFKGPEQTHQDKRMCNICDESVEGLYYQCEPCGFDVHPICSQLPQRVSHVHHLDHLLELSHQPGGSNTCMVCRRTIRSWRYKCGQCRLDVHMECVHSAASAAAITTQQRSFGSQQQFYPQFYQPYYNHQFYQPYYNQGYNQGYTNPGPVQNSDQSIGRRMFGILMALTVGVVCNVIASPLSTALGF
ncbi:Protein VACUOLELESS GAMETOPHYTES [Cardamine amara subsp. amara]|uniref:Protein VACUOLELESS GAMETOPHYTES n=1 Tax=Cardamine amara subsp. amara TaxID=228776 RepID=A0ABD1BFA4_CARAN